MAIAMNDSNTRTTTSGKKNKMNEKKQKKTEEKDNITLNEAHKSTHYKTT